MDGTPRQIAWAEQIKANLLPELDTVLDTCKRFLNLDDNDTGWQQIQDDAQTLGITLSHVNAARLPQLEQTVRSIRECESAKWFIEFGRYPAYTVITYANGNAGWPGARLP